jgi:fermentation-respiration switch protein FrsA (DUF1100 family)
MLTLLLAVGGGYLAVAGLAFAFQDQLLYFPSRTLVTTPDRYGLAYDTVHLDTEDGERLHGWWIPADDARGTLLFFHGNAGNISGRLESVQQFHQLDLNVLIVDYRGYGQSTGSPSEEGLYRDAEAAWQYLVGQRGIDPSRIVIFGRSLGGGPATWLAMQHAAGALLVESAFTSVPDVAAHHYPWLPARLLTTTQFDNRSRIDQIGMPLLVIHSRGDNVIPFHHGRDLFESAREPKQFLEIDGNHNDGFLVSADRYLRTIDQFLSTHLAPRSK